VTATARPVLLYDAECRFCRFAARIIARLDRRQRLAFLPLQDEVAPALLPDLPEERRFASIHVVEPSGERRSAGEALVQIARLLGLPAPDEVRHLYEPVARRRGLLGKLVPDGSAPRRFP